jgi:hypothetical protein
MKRKTITKEELDIKLINLNKQLGRLPLRNEFLSNNGSRIDYPIKKYYKTWNNFLFINFGKINKSGPTTNIKTTCTNCQKEVERVQSQAKITKNIFCSSSCAATYNNAHKDHGIRKSKLEQYLEEQVKNKYPNIPLLLNDRKTIKAELDIYLPTLRLAFEINGPVHYEPIYGQDKFEKIVNKDKQKSQLCFKNGIELCIIDTSKQRKFTEKSSQIYLDIVLNLIESVKNRHNI